MQVKRRDGGYIAVPCIPDAILLNLGRIMESWTSDMYLATVSLVANIFEHWLNWAKVCV